MKLLIPLSILMFLTGCATVPTDVPLATEPTVKFSKSAQDPKVVILDNNCAELARYARYVAILRDSGVKIEDVTVLTSDTPPGLAVSVINKEVYSRPDVSPDIGQKNSYDVCKSVGYDAISVTLRNAEKRFAEAELIKVRKLLEEKRKNLKTVKK